MAWLSALAIVSVAVAACGGASTSAPGAATGSGVSGETSGSNATTAGSSSPAAAGHLPISPPNTCGGQVEFVKKDPDGVLSKLVAAHPELQSWYAVYPYEVHGTPWSTWKGKPGPWSIGFVNFPVDNPWQVGLLNELKKEFAEAKAKGLVEGDLKVYIQPDWASATPEQQSSAIEQMVRDGVDAILVHPLNSRAETPAFEAAGRAGVPIILTGDTAPGSKYAVNLNTDNQVPGFADFFSLMKSKGWFHGETRTTLDVRGIQGNTVEQTYHDAAVAEMAACKGIKVVGTVWGQWNPATTKAEVLKFLASYPGKIDFVMHEGAMAGGIIQAFEQAGKPVPPMPISGTTGGDLAWWCAHKNEYDTVGYHFSGRQMAYAAFHIALRMLAGNQLQVRDIDPPGVKATNDNICDLATPGKPVTWVGDIRGPLTDYITPEQLDWFFATPGDPLSEG